ncbi:MaoC/PaaZ C-terminal domain-containing protein [Micrococcus sp.]|uniref:MaoC/PaaZ C-terminal domain-containing protein n=1 Tax=Micrococcus sp. TaxID=1271 RepID=UPI002A9198AC|nr:MaoC/PaaZ C-terminal domain-containing protein [Micrococcus sp.]MDY6055608.1 MaoC/PaaZ C-terminal domain-containing protein [Micrococcus sp.]
MTAPETQAPARPVLADLAKGDVVAEREIPLTRAGLVAYAAASGDHNPIHWNQSFAESVGLPGVIAHGMLTMGTAMQMVADWAGDPGAVVDCQTRFTSMVPVQDTTGLTDDDGAPVPGAVLRIRGVVGAVDEAAGTVRVDLTVEDPAQEKPRVLTKAQALVRLADGAEAGVADAAEGEGAGA